MVTKTAEVSYGNSFEVDAALVGRKCQLIFDPFDLTEIEVRYEGRAMGTAVPVRHRSPHPSQGPSRGRRRRWPTGIDYLALVGGPVRPSWAGGASTTPTLSGERRTREP